MSVSALDKLIASTSNHWPTLTPKARAELAQLRAELRAAQERSAEQARQLEEARSIMQHFTGLKVAADRQMAYDWLAANAPQPQDDERIDRMLSADKYYNDEIAEY